MTDDTTAILRRLDAVERNTSDQAKSITEFFAAVTRIEDGVERLAPLSDETVKFLGELRDEEVKTLRVLGRMDEEERKLVFEAIDLTKSFRRTARFLRWLAVGLLGIFLFFNQLSEQIGKLLTTFQGGPR
ncbi:hypothetical protein [Aureimonas sp. ME7]|uniref:hypothetical protein n=1 Tax=Aureimonas sp. ME7 TaxID=2744252 RepID=UPI0015FB6C37|nr:hypothetical protein [Aureimonas sp. ME7]